MKMLRLILRHSLGHYRCGTLRKLSSQPMSQGSYLGWRLIRLRAIYFCLKIHRFKILLTYIWSPSSLISHRWVLIQTMLLTTHKKNWLINWFAWYVMVLWNNQSSAKAARILSVSFVSTNGESRVSLAAQAAESILGSQRTSDLSWTFYKDWNSKSVTNVKTLNRYIVMTSTLNTCGWSVNLLGSHAL